MSDKLRDFYQSVKIDKTLDPSTLQAQEERKRAILEEKRVKLETQIEDAMEIITNNQAKGYCILDYSENPSSITKKLREGGFTVREERFTSLVGHRGCFERYSLIVSWQVFDDVTYEKIVRDLADAKRRQQSKFMSQD